LNAQKKRQLKVDRTVALAVLAAACSILETNRLQMKHEAVLTIVRKQWVFKADGKNRVSKDIDMNE
jgi:hypothetical protein